MITAASTEQQPHKSDLAGTVQELRRLAARSLSRMYRPDERLFAFRLRTERGQDVLEGVSRRYTATVLIGLAGQPAETATEALCGHGREEVCDRLLDDVEQFADLGEVALTAWAARALGHPRAHRAIDRLKRMDPVGRGHPTVELAWTLSALVAGGIDAADVPMADALARRMLASFRPKSGLFPHWPEGASRSLLRSHVTCFADFVYPTQALARYHQATGNAQAAEVACRSAERMGQLQGPRGQWWWHFDVRTGRVIERYPVYAIHQDSMAPMAFAAVREACGADHVASIEKGLRWLLDPPEIPGSLLDTDADLIWRKVARHEPGKLVRGLQAAASRLHPRLRVPGTNFLFRPSWIDQETRPYHMGWILYAWPGRESSPRPRE